MTNKLSDLALGSEYVKAKNYQHISDLPPALLPPKTPGDMKMFLQLATERGRNPAPPISKLRNRFHFFFQEVLIIRIPSLSQPPMNPDNSYSSQKLKCQESRMLCLKSRNVVEPLLCLTAVSETHPQAQPTYLQTRDPHLLCDDLRQPYDFHESCEMSCHYKEQKGPASRTRADKCTEKRPRNVSATSITSSM